MSTKPSEANKNETVVHAIPIEESTPIVVQSTRASPPNGVTTSSGSYHIEGENNEYGICRRCRRQFRRPVGVNDGQAQYYRCQECETHRFEDLIMGSCILS